VSPRNVLPCTILWLIWVSRQRNFASLFRTCWQAIKPREVRKTPRKNGVEFFIVSTLRIVGRAVDDFCFKFRIYQHFNLADTWRNFGSSNNGNSESWKKCGNHEVSVVDDLLSVDHTIQKTRSSWDTSETGTVSLAVARESVMRSRKILVNRIETTWNRNGMTVVWPAVSLPEIPAMATPQIGRNPETHQIKLCNKPLTIDASHGISSNPWQCDSLRSGTLKADNETERGYERKRER